MKRSRVVICSRNKRLSATVQESLPDWVVSHSPVPTAIGDADVVVLETDLENADVMLNGAMDQDKVCLTIVNTLDERCESILSGVFDAFQRHCLDVYVLAARIVQGLERQTALRERKFRLLAN